MTLWSSLASCTTLESNHICARVVCDLTRLKPYRVNTGNTMPLRLRNHLVVVGLVMFTVVATGCERDDLSGLVDLRGQHVNPFRESDAKATVALFVDDDCPISNRYAPELRRLHDKFSSKGVAFWLVYPDPDLSADDIRAHAKEYQYPMRVLHDPEHALVEMANALVTPEAAVFIPGSKLVYHGRIDDRFVDFNQQRPTPTQRDVEEVLDAITAGKRIEESWKPFLGIGCFIRDLKQDTS